MLELQSNEIHLWIVEDQLLTDQLLLEKYQNLLNVEEQKRFERLVFPKHKKQFLITRALLRSVLGGYLQQAPEELVFARNAYGKPRIASFEKSLPLSFKEFNQRFFNLWTLKEAYIKACGMGLAIPLKDFSFNFSDKGIGISFDEAREDNSELWQFWQFEYKTKFEVALALKLYQKQALKKIVSKQGRPLDKFSTFNIKTLNHSF